MTIFGYVIAKAKIWEEAAKSILQKQAEIDRLTVALGNSHIAFNNLKHSLSQLEDNHKAVACAYKDLVSRHSALVSKYRTLSKLADQHEAEIKRLKSKGCHG